MDINGEVLYNILKYTVRRLKFIANKIGGVWKISIILKRKILTAILSSLLFALVFLVLGGFEVNRFFNLYLNLYFLNFMFVITYGVIASI